MWDTEVKIKKIIKWISTHLVSPFLLLALVFSIAYLKSIVVTEIRFEFFPLLPSLSILMTHDDISFLSRRKKNIAIPIWMNIFNLDLTSSTFQIINIHIDSRLITMKITFFSITLRMKISDILALFIDNR